MRHVLRLFHLIFFIIKTCFGLDLSWECWECWKNLDNWCLLRYFDILQEILILSRLFESGHVKILDILKNLSQETCKINLLVNKYWYSLKLPGLS
jgi:hypothetical protein